MNIVKIPQSCGLKRKLPPNRGTLITRKYTRSFEKDYDWYTFCVDAIRVSRTEVLLICPRLEGLERLFQIKTKTGRNISFIVDRISAWTDHVIVKTTLNEFVVDFQGELATVKVTDRSERFKGKNIITTTQKDENINWILDWVGYYKKLHKIDSFIIYDNNSSTYTPEELENTVREAHPDVDFVVENMNIPYGARTTRCNCAYTQNTGFEHLKQKYAWCAKSVANHDIDEIMYLQEGLEYDQLIDEMISKNISFYTYHGHHVDIFDQEHKVTSDKLDYDQLKYYNYYRSICIGKQTKWVCLPSKRMNVAWTTHGMNETRGGLGDSFRMTNKISYGHYNSHRKFCSIDKYPQTYHIIDDLYSSLRKVYGDLVPMAKENKDPKESILIIRLSCQVEREKWPKLLKQTKLNQIIIYGDEDLKTNYKLEGKYLALKCKDDWEHLPEKMILAYKAISEIEEFRKYDYYVKVDSNYDPNRVVWPITRKTIKTMPESWGSVYSGPPGKGDYHLTKDLGPESYWHKRLYKSPWPRNRLNGGMGYGLSRRCLNIIAEFYDWTSSVRINREHIYEDVMVSHLLEKAGIFPSGYVNLGTLNYKKDTSKKKESPSIVPAAEEESETRQVTQASKNKKIKNLVVQIYFDNRLITDNPKTHTNHNRGPLITAKMKDHSLFEDSIEKARRYAKRCGADYVLFDKPVINYFSASMERMRLIEEEEWSEKYDNILYVDGDVIIKDTCPNLFDLYPQNTLRVCPTLMSKEWLLKKETTMVDYFGEKKVLNNYFNGGVILFHKSTLNLMRGKLKYRDRFHTYAFDDQSELNWVAMEHDIPMTMMDRQFNCKPTTKNGKMLHYLGAIKRTYKSTRPKDLIKRRSFGYKKVEKGVALVIRYSQLNQKGLWDMVKDLPLDELIVCCDPKLDRPYKMVDGVLYVKTTPDKQEHDILKTVTTMGEFKKYTHFGMIDINKNPDKYFNDIDLVRLKRIHLVGDSLRPTKESKLPFIASRRAITFYKKSGECPTDWRVLMDESGLEVFNFDFLMGK